MPFGSGFRWIAGWLSSSELDERVTTWRVRHFKVVGRIIGDSVVGTQGTPVEVLGRLIHHTFFPELWRARNDLTALSQQQT